MALQPKGLGREASQYIVSIFQRSRRVSLTPGARGLPRATKHTLYPRQELGCRGWLGSPPLLWDIGVLGRLRDRSPAWARDIGPGTPVIGGQGELFGRLCTLEGGAGHAWLPARFLHYSHLSSPSPDFPAPSLGRREQSSSPSCSPGWVATLNLSSPCATWLGTGADSWGGSGELFGTGCQEV